MFVFEHQIISVYNKTLNPSQTYENFYKVEKGLKQMQLQTARVKRHSKQRCLIVIKTFHFVISCD
jgi:hypothetical protein